MAGRMELGFPNKSTGNLKERLVRTTLRNVRAQGHPYVELREDGKKLIFFCTLCLAPCYGDSVLFNHLNGNLHTQMLATAKLTLLKPNPWPFNDGVFFFYDNLVDQNKSSPASDSRRIKLLETNHADNESAIVGYEENLGPNVNSPLSQEIDQADCDEVPCDQNLNGVGCYPELVIPSVLQKDKVSDLVVRHMGVGQIGARFSKKDGVSDEILRVWCEWLGNKDSENDDIDEVPEHDFAVVTFSYNYNLGRKGLLDSLRYLLPSSPHSETEDGCSSRGKKRKSFSDPESEYMSNRCDSSGEESQSSENPNMKMLLSGNDDQLVHSRVLSSKTMRKKLREQQLVAAERSCDLCQQKMLPNKDVAALLNRKTGKFVCSSRNLTGVGFHLQLLLLSIYSLYFTMIVVIFFFFLLGHHLSKLLSCMQAFHVFHISCLIHWILLCEVEIFVKQSVAPKLKRRSRRKVKGKDDGTRKNCEVQATRKQIYSAFCPECQGTGVETDGEDLEKPTVPLSEIFRYKIKLCDAHKAWMKNPEVLQNCSMGFHFPLPSDEIYQECVATLKLLHFYHAKV